MLMPAISLKLEGLEDLKKSLDSNKLTRELVAGVGIISLQLHNVLNNQIQSVYQINRSLNKVLINKTSLDIKRGANFISSGLEYKHEAINLAEFPSFSHFKGNINTDVSKPGLVQQVTIVRKRPYKIIKGKKHYGGFVPSNAKGIRTGDFKRVMFERLEKRTWIGKERTKLRVLYGPSLAQMAKIQFNLETGEVARFKNRIPNLLVKYINF